MVSMTRPLYNFNPKLKKIEVRKYFVYYEEVNSLYVAQLFRHISLAELYQ